MTSKLLFFLLFFVSVFACRQNNTGTYNYTSLQVDTNKVNIFKYDTLLYTFPKFSKPLALTNDDIKLVDSLLIAAVDSFNRTESKGLYEAFDKQFSIDSFTINLSKYKRQYFPYKDNNRQNVFQVICFSKPYSEWRRKIYYNGVHGGITVLRLRINLSDKKADEFSIGGYG